MLNKLMSEFIAQQATKKWVSVRESHLCCDIEKGDYPWPLYVLECLLPGLKDITSFLCPIFPHWLRPKACGYRKRE